MITFITLGLINIAIAFFVTYKLDLLKLGQVQFLDFIKTMSATSVLVIGLTALFGTLSLFLAYVVVVNTFDYDSKLPSWDVFNDNNG